MAFKALKNSNVALGNAGIPPSERDKYYCTICVSVEPNEKLERGTGHYFCDIHISKEQLKDFVESAQRYLRAN